MTWPEQSGTGFAGIGVQLPTTPLVCLSKEGETTMTLREFREATKKLSPDAELVFRDNSEDPKTDHNVTRVLDSPSYGDLHYVILGGYL